jgi:head-tail adaptor
VRFQLDVEAANRFEAMRMVLNTALQYDDHRKTRIIAVEELS